MDNTVSVISQKTNQVTNTWSTGASPSSMAFDAASKSLYVANYKASTLSVIDTTTGQSAGTINIGSATQPSAIALDPSTSTLYVYLAGSGTVLPVSAKTGKVIETSGFNGLSSAEMGLGVDSTTHHVYVTEQHSGSSSTGGSQTAYGTVNVFQGVSS